MAEKEIAAQGDSIQFLGTSGARFVMIRQLRATAGIWVSSGGSNVLIDPGPGSLVHCAAHKPGCDPETLDAIILTHRHLDHAGDINVMIEAMTEGGFKKRGVVFCPQEALNEDPVILSYLRGFPQSIEIIQAGSCYSAGSFQFTTSLRHAHSAETYGLKFPLGGLTVSLIADTKYSSALAVDYKADIVIIPTVFLHPHPEISHLSFPEARALIEEIRPQKAILTHFGLSMLSAGPELLAQQLTNETGVTVVAAYDGMRFVPESFTA